MTYSLIIHCNGFNYFSGVFFYSRQIYWLGDLNYRITDLTTNHVRTLVAQKEYDTLLKVDQLSQQRERGNVLLVRCLCLVIYLIVELKIVFW